MSNANGVWNYTPVGLADGPHTIVASETNALGETGFASVSFNLETASPTVDINSSGGITRNGDQTLTGVVFRSEAPVAGTTITIYDNGISNPIGTTIVSANGTWSANITLNGYGVHDIFATDTDAAGNTATSNTVAFDYEAGLFNALY